jgi:hypothetical protein
LRAGPNLARDPRADGLVLDLVLYLIEFEIEARGDGTTLRGADPHIRSIVELTRYRVYALGVENAHMDRAVDFDDCSLD